VEQFNKHTKSLILMPLIIEGISQLQLDEIQAHIKLELMIVAQHVQAQAVK